MIRLTLILLAAIFATLTVAGREPGPEAPGAAGVEVARSASDPVKGAPRPLAVREAGGAQDRAVQDRAVQDRTASFGDAAGRAERAEGASALRRDRAEAAAPGAAGGGDLALVNAERVNLRAGPSTADAVLDQVVRDQPVRILRRQEDGWARISVPASGLEAWIFASFLSPPG